MDNLLSPLRCFLCRRKDTEKNQYRLIDSSYCPESKKCTRNVLLYLARQIKAELHIPRAQYLCLYCYSQLIEYDAIVMKALRKERSLSKLIERAIIDIDSDIEDECDEHMKTLNELQDENFFDDFVISDHEITQTVAEAINPTRCEMEKPCNKLDILVERRGLKRKLLKCTFCAMKFKSKTRLQKHLTQSHKKFSCELCDFAHRNEDYLKLHMNLHEGRKENQCRFCDKEFTTKISTIRHMEVHFDSKKYQCDKCGLCFSQTTVLYNHKLQHEAEERPLRCEICNQIFKTKRTYRHHMITHRADRPRYSCEYCAKTFTEKYTLKVHKRTHPEATQSSQPQPEQETHNAVASLIQEQHQLQATIDLKFNCIICEQAFANKDHLNKHMEKEHDVILKSLTVSNFTEYEVVTNDEKKPCHICGHWFSTQINLDYHLEHVHAVAFH